MKIKLGVALLSIFVLMALALGCAQVVTGAPVEKPASSANVQAVALAGNEPVATNATENNSSTSSPTAVPGPKLTKISDILQSPKTYGGKIVIVEGKIVSECGSGCWFTLRDSSAVIYIDLAPNNVVIPQKRGSNARVTGEVVYDGSDVYMVGSKVDF